MPEARKLSLQTVPDNNALTLLSNQANGIANLWLQSGSSAPRLKIGFLLDSLVLPAWMASIIRQVSASNFAGIDLAVLDARRNPQEQAAPAKRSLFTRLKVLANKQKRSRLLYALYTKWDENAFAGTENSPFDPVDCSEFFKGARLLEVQPITRGFVDRFPSDALEEIHAEKLDVLFRFGFNIIRGDVLKAARYGVWSFHHGDNDYYRGGPPHFWEMAEQNPTSGVILQVLSEELDAGQVLAKAVHSTDRGLSMLNNRWTPYWAGSFFAIRKLHELHEHGWERVQREVVPNAPYAGRKKLYRLPENGVMAAFLLRRASVALANRLSGRSRRRPRWRVAVRTGHPQTLLPGQPLNMDGFRWIEPPQGHFQADPFVMEHEGKTWLFMEDFDYSRELGSIVCREVFPNGEIGPLHAVLSPGHHLSFPFVFKIGGCVYMMPESGADRTVSLYRPVRFPFEWEQDTTLISGAKAVDAVIHQHDGLFWLFVTIMDPSAGGNCPHLFLFYSDSLQDGWKSHPSNPICTDIRFMRSAGAILEQDGMLIRPAQDFTEGYGYAVSFRQIVSLTKTDYREQTFAQLLPGWSPGLEGTHTYNRCGTAEVVDGFTFERVRLSPRRIRQR